MKLIIIDPGGHFGGHLQEALQQGEFVVVQSVEQARVQGLLQVARALQRRWEEPRASRKRSLDPCLDVYRFNDVDRSVLELRELTRVENLILAMPHHIARPSVEQKRADQAAFRKLFEAKLPPDPAPLTYGQAQPRFMGYFGKRRRW